MKWSKKTWLLILSALITGIGLLTGWYFFLLLILPFGLFGFDKKDENQ